MPQLTKSEFARLVAEMPDASEDDILVEARKRTAAKYDTPPSEGKRLNG